MSSSINSKEFKPVRTDGIDFNKLRVIFWDNILYVALIFVVINLVAYVIVRYTKDVYESVSEIKLEVKNEASDLGFSALGIEGNQSSDLISGEIEILRSRLFLDKVLDSLDLSVTYFNKGEVLNHELFSNAPVRVSHVEDDFIGYGIPIFLELKNDRTYVLRWGNEVVQEYQGMLDQLETTPLGKLTIKRNVYVDTEGMNVFFIVNTRESQLSYILRNLFVDPLNYYAKTIRIAFRDNNPEKARAIVHTINSVYVAYSYEQKNLANRQKIEWLNNELKQIEMKMEGFEEYFKDFTLRNKTNNLDEDLSKTIRSIAVLDSQRYEWSRRISELDKLSASLAKGEYIVPPTLRLVLPTYLTTRLDDLQRMLLEQEKLKMAYSEATFAYRQHQQEIDIQRSKVQNHLSELKADWLVRTQEVMKRKNELEHQFINMPDKTTQFNKNQRFYKLYEEFYLTLMQSKAGFEIAQAGSTLDFKILTPASISPQPISPNRMMVLGVGLIISLVIIFFFIGVLYLLNDKITNLQELERNSGVPVIGVIPSSKAGIHDNLHVLSNPKSMVSEAIRTIRTNLDFFKADDAQTVIAISSTISGEGKSFVSMNLGAALALSGKRVLLVDLDMRKVKSYVPAENIDPSAGISTVLINKSTWKSCVATTSIPTYDYLASGPNPPNPSELLLGKKFESILQEMRKEYDYILLDTPPVGLVTDGIQAMRLADISIYIFRANYSKREFLLNLQRIIKINRIKNVTALLNDMQSAGEKAYGYGYGYYEEGTKRLGKIKSFFKV
jgi:tyrosine-protein kinase Etk/Wzc